MTNIAPLSIFGCELMYGKKGFTRKILKMLGKPDDESFGYRSYTISAETLIAIAEKLPKANLDDRQNGSPTLSDFVEFAKKSPDSKFKIHVITEVRPDERVTVEGVYFPKGDKHVSELRSKALREPDSESPQHMWWD